MKAFPSFVAIEGVDGVGKTTLARRLEKEHGYYYLYTLPEPLKQIRTEIEMLQFSEARFFYYLSCVIVFQRELRTLLNQGYRVIVDRYIFSTFAMHKAMGVNVDCVEMDALPITLPDLTILLTCDSLVRNERILARGIEKEEYVRLKSPLLNNAEIFFLDFCDVISILDTTDKNADVVFQDAVGLLG